MSVILSTFFESYIFYPRSIILEEGLDPLEMNQVCDEVCSLL